MLARSLLLRQLLAPTAFTLRAAPMVQFQMANFAFVAQQQRLFAKKSKKSGSKNDAGTSDAEPEAAPVHHAAPTRATKFDWTAQANQDSLDAPKLDAEFFKPFSVGDNIKRVASAPDHRPPSFEDTIEGRYAASLFISASQNGKLFEVYEDVVYLNHLYKHCEHFRLFTENNGIGLADVMKLNSALRETAHFDDVTFKFLVVLAESKRLIYLREISEKYAKLYMQLNKEEKITIISASELNDGQRGQVLDALKANPKNEGKQFVIQY